MPLRFPAPCHGPDIRASKTGGPVHPRTEDTDSPHRPLSFHGSGIWLFPQSSRAVLPPARKFSDTSPCRYPAVFRQGRLRLESFPRFFPHADSRRQGARRSAAFGRAPHCPRDIEQKHWTESRAQLLSHVRLRGSRGLPVLLLKAPRRLRQARAHRKARFSLLL